MASAVDSRLAYARLSAVATASRLPTANRGSNNSYTTSWDTTPANDRKTTRLDTSPANRSEPIQSTQLFHHREAREAWPTDLAIAVLNARKEARMRVLPHHLDWVISLVGPESAAGCNSLPSAVRLRASAKAP